MPKSDKAANFALEQRLDKVEDLLVAGVGPGRIERVMAEEYGVSSRQGRRYVDAVYDRWRKQTVADAPHRREKTIRMAERFFAKCLAEGQHSAAASALTLLGRMSGAFTPNDATRDARIAALGAPPDDPTLALIWAQRCMAMALQEVVCNPSLDPERRLRWIAELGGKLGMTHAKSLVEAKLDVVAARVLGPATEGAQSDYASTSGVTFPQTSRHGKGEPS